jgi:hypothetical protein
MAQSQPRDEGQAEFVRQIVTDPKNVPDVMRLYGYLGASSEENHNRLYLNPDLSVYVEVPTAAILHRVAAPAEQDANGGVTLWVRRDAALIYKSAPAAQALAQYFAGAIAGAAAAAPGAAAAAMPAAPMPFVASGAANVACTAACATPACASAACATPACAHTPLCATHVRTLCAAGGALCTADCPTYPQLCGGTPICQVTAICQPTRMTPCFPTAGCGGGGGGGGGGDDSIIGCVTDVPALAAAAFGYPTANWLCFPTPACHFGAGAGQVGIGAAAAAFGYRTANWLCFPTPACHFGVGGGQVGIGAAAAATRVPGLCVYRTDVCTLNCSPLCVEPTHICPTGQCPPQPTPDCNLTPACQPQVQAAAMLARQGGQVGLNTNVWGECRTAGACATAGLPACLTQAPGWCHPFGSIFACAQ